MAIRGKGYTLGRVSRHFGTRGEAQVNVALRVVVGQEPRWYAWLGVHEAPQREWHQVDGESERQFLKRVTAEVDTHVPSPRTVPSAVVRANGER